MSSVRNPPRRARCSVCRSNQIVRKDGKFRIHMRIQKGRWHMVPCEGSDQDAPTEEAR